MKRAAAIGDLRALGNEYGRSLCKKKKSKKEEYSLWNMPKDLAKSIGEWMGFKARRVLSSTCWNGHRFAKSNPPTMGELFRLYREVSFVTDPNQGYYRPMPFHNDVLGYNFFGGSFAQIFTTVKFGSDAREVKIKVWNRKPDQSVLMKQWTCGIHVLQHNGPIDAQPIWFSPSALSLATDGNPVLLYKQFLNKLGEFIVIRALFAQRLQIYPEFNM